MMHDDIYSIVSKLDAISENLNPQQRSVKQMPALFKMKPQGPVLGGDPNKPAPSKGYYFGGESEEMDEAVLGGTVKGGPRDAEDFAFKLKDLRDRINRATDVSTREYLKFALADLERVARDRGIIDDQGRIKEGRLINPDEQDNPVAQAIIHRILTQRVDLLSKYGPELVGNAVDDVADFVGDVEEIGSSDVSAYVNQVENYLRDQHGNRDEISEDTTTEDVVSAVKKKLGDYLQDVATAIKKDPDLVDKLPADVDQIGPAVKTITTDDGHEIKIHGNEDDGFRVSIKNKPGKTQFGNLDEAVMAVEMWCARRRGPTMETQDQDYVEEKKCY